MIPVNGIKNLSAIFFPEACLACGKEIDTAGFCGDCKKNIKYMEPPFCTRCGKPFTSREGVSHICMDCIKNKNKFERARCVFEYSGTIAKLIQRFKFSDQVNLSSFFIKELFTLYQRDFPGTGIDAIVPVPLSAKRLRQRSYNQALLLARGLSKKLRIEYYQGILEKIRETAPQSTLHADKRYENVKDAYAVSNKRMIKGKRILLVDDVITTGATVNACVSALKKAGTKKVQVLAIAMRV